MPIRHAVLSYGGATHGVRPGEVNLRSCRTQPGRRDTTASADLRRAALPFQRSRIPRRELLLTELRDTCSEPRLLCRLADAALSRSRARAYTRGSARRFRRTGGENDDAQADLRVGPARGDRAGNAGGCHAGADDQRLSVLRPDRLSAVLRAVGGKLFPLPVLQENPGVQELNLFD